MSYTHAHFPRFLLLLYSPVNVLDGVQTFSLAAVESEEKEEAEKRKKEEVKEEERPTDWQRIPQHSPKFLEITDLQLDSDKHRDQLPPSLRAHFRPEQLLFLSKKKR